MGWYEQRVFNPLILDKSLDVPEVHAERARMLAGAEGAVLEIGVGTGLNLASYPETINQVTSVGPEDAPHAYALRRAAERGLHLDHVHGDAGRLPFFAGRFDTVVCSFVLCTVPDARAAVHEMRRVLRPGGRLLFLEHVAAPGGVRRVAQRILRRTLRAALCGCEVTRDTETALLLGGFQIAEIARFELAPMSWLHRSVIRGMARPRSA